MTLAVTENTGLSPSDIEIVDMDLDGSLDIIVAQSDQGRVTIFYNNALDFTTQLHQNSVNFSPRNLTIGDINGDGYPDVVSSEASGNFVNVMLSMTANTYTTGNSLSGIWHPGKTVLRDLDADGDLDLIVGSYSWNNVQVFFNEMGDYTSNPPRYITTVGKNPQGIFVQDLNADGVPDILVQTDSGLEKFLYVP